MATGIGELVLMLWLPVRGWKIPGPALATSPALDIGE